ncbi:CGNR zinc finger domain-containing protein [Roseibium aggregatum]|uniref:CGNR zinc finger domain-containing protein n=1 Tax=Roseibium aggregatum TaxID=187304 RepID=A0A939EHT3_9HYPH|nr:ABATE domain-containing protein [Roseibium aggregatum]MBN9673279.1 CGNR zinc finger domain-containing protein [Roseibium aggregatum]
MREISQPPILIADHPALDLLNSVAAPRDEEIEWIGTGNDLLTWIGASGLLEPDQAEGCRRKFEQEDLDDVARRVIALREWFRRLLKEQSDPEGWRISGEDLQYLNAILAAGTYLFQLNASHGEKPGLVSGISLQGTIDVRSPDDLLFPIALQIADFLAAVSPHDTRRCANEACTLWFVDVTKNKRRRWCDMSVCGNRAKAAGFRARKAETGKSGTGKV